MRNLHTTFATPGARKPLNVSDMSTVESASASSDDEETTPLNITDDIGLLDPLYARLPQTATETIRQSQVVGVIGYTFLFDTKKNELESVRYARMTDAISRLMSHVEALSECEHLQYVIDVIAMDRQQSDLLVAKSRRKHVAWYQFRGIAVNCARAEIHNRATDLARLYISRISGAEQPQGLDLMGRLGDVIMLKQMLDWIRKEIIKTWQDAECIYVTKATVELLTLSDILRAYQHWLLGEILMKSVHAAELRQTVVSDTDKQQRCMLAASHFFACRSVLETVPPSVSMCCEGQARFPNFEHKCRNRVNYRCDVKGIDFTQDNKEAAKIAYADKPWPVKAFAHYLLPAAHAKRLKGEPSYAVALLRTAAANGCYVENGRHVQKMAIDSHVPIPASVASVETEFCIPDEKEEEVFYWSALRLNKPISAAHNPKAHRGILLARLLEADDETTNPPQS
jgi:hypothetical protein